MTRSGPKWHGRLMTSHVCLAILFGKLCGAGAYQTRQQAVAVFGETRDVNLSKEVRPHVDHHHKHRSLLPKLRIHRTRQENLLNVDEVTLTLEELPELGPSSIPGLEASRRYSTRVLAGGRPGELMTFFSYSKRASENATDCNGYFSHLENWTASWVNLEMRKNASTGKYKPVKLQVSKLFGDKVIKSATASPARVAVTIEVREGKAIVTVREPCQFNLDINGFMDTTDTGPMYVGGPVHTYSIFANPELENKPDPSSKHVRVVHAGHKVPKHFNESTLYFATGVHELGTAESNKPYQLLAGKSYYIPIDAWLKGALITEQDKRENADIHLFGYGHVSGVGIERKQCMPNIYPEGLHMHVVVNTTVAGLTFVDHPNHHVVLGGGDDPSRPNMLRNVKVMGWRANGDGVHVCSYWTVKDLFLRTQDDSMYIASCAQGASFDRVVTWNDANGAAFIFTAHGGGMNVALANSDAIYSRSTWAFWSGGRVFSLRGIDDDAVVSNITIDRLHASDPLPTMPFLDFNAHPVQSQLLLQMPTKRRRRKISFLCKRKRRNVHRRASRVEEEEEEEEEDEDDDEGSRSSLFERMMRNAEEFMIYNAEKFASDKLAGSFKDITISNLQVRNYSSVPFDLEGEKLPHGLVNIINGSQTSHIENVAFKNVTIAGHRMSALVNDPTYFYWSDEGLVNVTVDDEDLVALLQKGDVRKLVPHLALMRGLPRDPVAWIKV